MHKLDKSLLKYSPKMYIIIELIYCLYDQPDGACGGLCHIVTDDNNIDDYSLQFVIDECKKPEHNDAADKELSSLICELMLQLNFDQRLLLFKIMEDDGQFAVLHDGYCFIDESMWNAFVDQYAEFHEYIDESSYSSEVNY